MSGARPPSTSGPSGDPDTRAIVRPREFTFRRFRLTVTAGPDRGAEHVADTPEICIGTAEGNQLVLRDPTVSRHHCAITAADEGFRVRDLESTNGTSVAGVRVESAFLRSGMCLSLGETTVRFEGLDAEVHEPLSDDERFGRLLGASAAMRRVFALLPRVAASEATVLLEGETGTGKGLLAEAIHQHSPRARGPLVVLDCSAIPPSLIEAELFGHTKGAFTGAYAARPGVFEAAAGGTVFLDEIGELPLEMQPKLLRALEDRVVRRIGSVEPVRLDVRVIAATNRDLRQEVNRGTFRSDLFYRLHVVRIRIPPLRERREDIALLASHFYEQLARDPEAGPPAALIDALCRQEWPGNVRELRSAMERAVLMEDAAPGQDLGGSAATAAGAATAADEEERFDPTLSFRAAKEQATARWERSYLRALVRASSGNLSAAARAARMDRTHLRELLRRHGVHARED
jgi:DNA-binding NtrC family response regulator